MFPERKERPKISVIKGKKLTEREKLEQKTKTTNDDNPRCEACHATYKEDEELGLCRVWVQCDVCQLTYRQPAQNGVLTDQLCRAIYCIHLSIMPMQTAITIT